MQILSYGLSPQTRSQSIVGFEGLPAIVSELEPQTEDIIVYKHRFSGFFETELDDVLRKLGVKYLIVTGCTTSVCVESTVRDAMFRDYSCVLLADCMGNPSGMVYRGAIMRHRF